MRSYYGVLAQLGERYTGSVEVSGSIPLCSTMESVIVMIADFFLYVNLLNCCFVYDIISI